MTGSFSNSSGNALIQEIKTIEVKMDLGHSACIEKFLEGTFTSIIEKNDSISNKKRGDDCGGGKMILRKVVASDFYVEPFLRKKNLPINNEPPLVKNNPAPNNTTVKTNNKPSSTPPKKKINPDNTNTTTVLVKPKIDTAKKAESNISQPDNRNLTVKTNKMPEALRSRENNLLQTMVVNSENVVVKLYDNGEIDDDTISIYLDKQLILSKKRLSAAALTVNLKMDEDNPDHELVMVAENLGRIPPNTSLMIVTAGDQRYEVRITSTEQKNAMVRFKYVKKAIPLP